MAYRVALRGFAELDRLALASLLRDADRRAPGYQLVQLPANADVVLADGDSAQVVAEVVRESRAKSTLFLSERPPSAAVWHTGRSPSRVQLLRALDELVAHLDRAPAVATWRVDDAHLQAQAVERGAARRARLATATVANGAPPMPNDVLVLDADGTARDRLCGLLEGFGFCAYPAVSLSQAIWLLQTQQFAAAFVDLLRDEVDAGAVVELGELLRRGPRHPDWPEAALYIVSREALPACHAALAGRDSLLVKPLSRGDVARALEGRGIPLPADARRG